MGLGRLIHVLPLDDVGLHLDDGVHCNCNPKVESFDEFSLVIHNAFDGRELFGEESLAQREARNESEQ
jgi:hypothetical protein